jgi:hypothetical protein
MQEHSTDRGVDSTSTLDSAESQSESRPTVSFSEHHRRMVFYEMIKAEMDGEILRYNKRRQLLRFARKLGIPQFEASLMIAEVQYRDGQLTPPRLLSNHEIMDKLDAANQSNALMRNVVIASAAAIVLNLWMVHLFF